MKKEIRLCLVYRDMWQSAGKYMPVKAQLVKVAEPIIAMGCFDRVETNGGGFEQINLLMGEDPNASVRAWTAPFHKAGIQTQMLERGLNGLRMSPCAADLRRLMFRVKKKQGTDIARSFDGLNNPESLTLSFQYAKEAGMISQAALCITVSPIHTDDYYISLADQFIDLGTEELCVKDMAGVGRPASIGRIVRGIKARHPDILIQYHAHSTPGFSVASALEAARNGAEIIDVGMEPLSWGTGHADLLTIHAMLTDAGFAVPDVNMEAYMHARHLSQSFIDEYLGYFIDPDNRYLNSILIGSGLPGGMMGSLMADLEKNLISLNKWMEKHDRSPVTKNELFLQLLKEVEYVWPQLGYPPLVTPFSQYVKNVALMNVIQMLKGQPRWTMIDENTWSMILGKAGKLPGKVGPEIGQLAKAQGREFFNGDPQSLYADCLDDFATQLDAHMWPFGADNEELFEYAMHPREYEAYKSGKAKEAFLEDIHLHEQKAASPVQVPAKESDDLPKSMIVEVNGEKYAVHISYDKTAGRMHESKSSSGNGRASAKNGAALAAITAPLEGKFFLTKESSERPLKVGDVVHKGDTVAYIESMKVINAITADKEGTVTEIVAQHGSPVEEDDVIIRLSPA
jgi:pyruvate carboxylase subunit B